MGYHAYPVRFITRPTRCIRLHAIAVVFAMLAVMPIAAFAQSSVTLYGSIDTGIEYLTNVSGTSHSLFKAGNSEINGNYFGLIGTEDLGGGIKAIFKLESGFNPDTGGLLQGGRLFGRQAWVGVANDHNKVIFGRVYVPLYDVIGYLDPLQGSNISLWTMDSGFVARMDNAVRYARSDGPFHENVQYSFGSNAVDTTINGTAGAGGQTKEFAVSADYTTTTLMIGLVYDRINGPMTAPQYSLGLVAPSLQPAAPIAPDRAERLAGAARYTRGKTALFAGIRHLKSTVQAVDHESNIYWAGLTETLTPSWITTIAAYHERVAGINARPTMIALQTRYLLSKSTALYANIGKLWNTRLSNLGIDTQTQTMVGAGQLGVNIGIYHFF